MSIKNFEQFSESIDNYYIGVNEALEINENYQPTYWSERGTEQDKYEELWDELVPGLGEADTEAGELVRSISKIYYDLYNNGFGNGPFRKEWTKVMGNGEVWDQLREDGHGEARSIFRKFLEFTDYGKKIVSTTEGKYDKQMEALDKVMTSVVRAAWKMYQENQ